MGAPLGKPPLLHACQVDQDERAGPLIKCPVDTKTVDQEGRTPRGLSVSSDLLPRSGSHQCRVETLPDQEVDQGL